ncbi:tRNA glutamyl-Q(34) synthetase GluQRS [Thalassotalea profundi]|uniref:Glutamyl-Q tRNA(Asp) synthetase n=1 Tax=Thalassotalea profundi TaxID=2036687 RepID=A0ABQ3J161_9GAMM|nr:tRNA glutamyl-Q(34) synthetase GluQRS [Thalassotalea profundi]GHF00528.1 glutamyl-Q tRNA(Asp) synthetase [Thalassotalea profundi]
MQNSISERHDNPYRGRFAPSPSGLLHFGSLITALASFLDARKNNGIWLVRIEDIDPPRELAGASENILKTLDAYGLHWDENVLYQSKQSERYRALLNQLHKSHRCYYCQCTRANIKALGGIYQGHCRQLNCSHHHAAVRLINTHPINHFTDIIQGSVHGDDALANEDFIIHRKDGLFAYQLAVVADDIYQKITHVIRGCDLLEPTMRQLTLFDTLDKSPPQYGHIPLAVTSEGYKLSKQNKAPAIDISAPQKSLVQALAFLGQQPAPSLINASVAQIIEWAIEHWQIDNVPKVQKITLFEQ